MAMLEPGESPELKRLNPWNLPADDEYCWNIRIKCDTTFSSGKHIIYDAVVFVPDAEVGPQHDLERAATLAFLACRNEGLEAEMMSYCAFAAYEYTTEEEEGRWRWFDPASGELLDEDEEDEQ